MYETVESKLKILGKERARDGAGFPRGPGAGGLAGGGASSTKTRKEGMKNNGRPLRQDSREQELRHHTPFALRAWNTLEMNGILGIDGCYYIFFLN